MQKYLRYKSKKKTKKGSRLEWQPAPDVGKRLENIITDLNIDWVKKERIYCFRSKNSTSKARARIWGLPRVWQKALDIESAYIIEVLSEKFDNLSNERKDSIIIHELAHIPKNFSGALLPHIRKRGKRNFKDRVQNLVKRYFDKKE